MRTQQIILYLAIVFGISWALELAAVFTTPGIDSEAAESWLLGTMFVPALVTALWLFRDKTLRSKVLWKPRRGFFKASALAVLVPTGIALAVLALFETTGQGHSGWFEFSGAGVQISGGPWILGQGEQGWALFVLNVLCTGLVFSLLNALPAAGEEFAWRGFLQEILVEKVGRLRGIALLGVLWSFWHLPALLAGYNHPEYPVAGSFIISPLELVAVSFFMAWLTVSCKSFIPAAIAHGAGNSIQEGLVSNIQLQVPRLYEDLAVLGVTVVVGLVFGYFLKKYPDRYSV